MISELRKIITIYDDPWPDISQAERERSLIGLLKEAYEMFSEEQAIRLIQTKVITHTAWKTAEILSIRHKSDPTIHILREEK